MAVANGLLFFDAQPSGSFRPNQLWVSDGTGGGTHLFQSFNGSVGGLVGVGNRLYFTGDDGTGPKLWVVNPGAGSATQVTAGGSTLDLPSGVVAVSTTGFVVAGATGSKRLYRLDPATGAASLVVDGASAAVVVSDTPNLGALGAQALFFNGLSGGAPVLWKVGPTGAASQVLAGGQAVSNPGPMAALGASVYFAADGAAGRELWKSDGSSAGTGQIKDINPGAAGSSPVVLGAAGASLLFFADNGVNGAEPWITDGTSGGTRLAADINPGAGSSLPSSGGALLGVLGNTVLLAASDGSRGVEPWLLNLASSNTPPTLDTIADQVVAVGQQVRFQATASDPDVGSVLTFTLDGPPQGASIESSTGVFTWTPATPGTTTITVRVTDNGSPAQSATRHFNVTATGIGTTTQIGFDPPTISYGQSSIFHLAVTPNAGSGTPGGVVIVYNGANELGRTNLSNGVGSVTVAAGSLDAGTYHIHAVYQGGGIYASSPTQTWDFVVSPAATTVQVNSATSSINANNPVTFNATLTGASGTTPTGGTVTFFDGNMPLGAANVSGGTASLQVNGLAVGAHAITATYSGSTDFQGNTSPAWSFTVNPAGSTTTVTVPSGTFAVGQAFTVSVRVTSPKGTPTGKVTFFDGNTALGTVNLTNGSASLKVTKALPPGARMITARYLGNGTIPTSTSTAKRVTVNTSTVKSISVTRSGNTITKIVLKTSGLLDAKSVAKIANYTLAFGRKSGSTTTYNINIGLRSATYSASGNTITIIPSGGRINFAGSTLNSTARLQVNSVRDVSGSLLRNTAAKGTFTAYLTRSTVKTA
jgi:ELWxxDGT repeat protein